MHQRAAVIALAVLLVLPLSTSAQSFPSRSRVHSEAVSGVVLNAQGKPVADARVDVIDLRTGRVLESTYSGATGGFEIDGGAMREVEIVATSGILQARERASIAGFGATVTLRLPGQAEAEGVATSDHTVSVRQLRVPRRAAGELARAQRALNKGDLDRAQHHIKRALERHQHFPEALTLRAVLKVHDEDVAGAIEDLERALAIDADHVMAYIVMAATFNDTHEYEKAVRSADRALSLAPNTWQAHFEMGKAMLALGDHKAALDQFGSAERLSPKEYLPLHLARAHALLGLQDYDTATAALQQYLAGEPEGPASVQARRTLEEVRAFRASNQP
jgi:tetratricopeptide (TPR) repeat protein